MKTTQVLQFLWLILLWTTAMEVYQEDSFAEFESDNLGAVKYQWSFFENFSIFSYLPIKDKIDDDKFHTPIVGEKNLDVYFSFWNDSDIECTNPLDDRGSALLVDSSKPGELDCTRISSNNWNDVNVTYVENPIDRSRDYLRLTWEGPDPCPFASGNWSYSIDVVCSDVSVEDSRFFYTGGYDPSCRIKTQFESKLGCAIVSFNQLWTYLKENQTVFAIILIVVGVFLSFLGYRIIIISLFIAGFLATIVVLMIVAVQFIVKPNTPQYVFWIWLAVSGVIGALLGFVVAKYRRVGIFLLACWGGACLGLLLNNAVMRYAESEALFWIVICACGLAAGVLSCFLYVIVAIASTSLAGSYALVRGVSIFIGHFPNELTIIQEIKNGIIPKTDWHFWAYLACVLVLAILSFFLQWKTRPERKNGKKKNGEYYRHLDP
jgi:hypothetical protein